MGSVQAYSKSGFPCRQERPDPGVRGRQLGQSDREISHTLFFILPRGILSERKSFRFLQSCTKSRAVEKGI